MQQAWNGRVNILGELVQQGMGAERMIKERVQPYVAEWFPGARLMFSLDPASMARSSNDESRIRMIFKRFYPHGTWTETNNRMPLRINAYDYYLTNMVEGGPKLQIDGARCPNLIRALKGGWRFGIDVKKDELKGADPEKNQWSHIGDACGYGLRFFHKGVVLQEGGRSGSFTPPRSYGNEYHMT
jgi:hypothetical protein